MTAHIHEDSNRTTPIGLSRYAMEFFDAALSVDKDIGSRPGYEIVAPVPVLYLVGHSIELSLKAYLLHKGVSLKSLRLKYGHNLHKCFKKAKDFGLLNSVSFDEHEIGAFKVLNELYSTKQLEYIVIGSKAFPVFGYIETFNRKLIDTIGPIVGYR